MECEASVRRLEGKVKGFGLGLRVFGLASGVYDYLQLFYRVQ